MKETPFAKKLATLKRQRITMKAIFPKPNNISPFKFQHLLINKNGQVTLLALTFSLFLIAFTLLIILKSQKTSRLIQYRTETYLCAQKLDIEVSHYTKKMAVLNSQILIAYQLKINPVTAKEGIILHQTLLALEQVLHFSFLKNITTNKKCSDENILFYVKSLPYKTRGIITLVRDFDGTTQITSNKWSTWIYEKRLGDLNFLISTKYLLKNKFSSLQKLNQTEVSQSLNPLSGSPFGPF